jgi:tetratricopeptide (TPR) repeat protein
MLVLSFAGIIGWLTAMLSLSKGAFIAGIAGFAVFFVGVCLFSPTIFRRRSIAFAVVWLAVTIGTQVLFSVFSAVPSTTDYITGKADPTRTTTEMRIFTWTVGRQMARDHWLAGVGADNFGVAYNDARIQMRLRHPDVPKQEIAEDYLTERAHNEPLQVLAELGVPGFGLFALPFALFAFLLVRKFWRQGFRLSPVLWASAAGMIAFAVSSMVSSFSFRSAQNGVVFFLVFAIAVNELNKSADISTIGDRASYFTAAFCWLSVLLLALYCMAEGFAEYQVYTGERTESPAAAQSRFHSALIADPGYSGAYLSSAARYAAEGDQATAALMTRKAIDTGIGLSLTYSQLAHQQVAAGDNDGAEATYREAIKVYPRSIFIRVEFVVFLENSGRHDAATDELKAAVALEPRQANGWYVLIKSGSTAAFYRSRSAPAIAAPVELLPASAVYHYLDKTPEK